MKRSKNNQWLRGLGLCVVFILLAFSSAKAISWYPVGPFGGDARSFAADPNDSKHLYLGTVNGWLYESHDGGSNWARVSQPGKRDDLVLEHVLVDPTDAKRIIVGAFRVNFEEGGIYVSQDAGKTWYVQAQMSGQAVLSMARSESNPHMIVAGTIKGIYRSNDDGMHWQSISPADNKELHEVESVAIDPENPKVIYAGTWHLPWKTEDGGENWTNIKTGIIDDSDVFSIVLDSETPSTVYLSACSGIYKSVDAAAKFDKIQGIPKTARRTRKLLQDPTNHDIVYAGTTEGLYKTYDAGKNWQRTTAPNLIVNDVYVDPKNPTHVLLATDRGGVLRSDDGGTVFENSNVGFSARQVSSFARDLHNPSLLYAGIVNDKEWGGVYQSNDGGLKWEQQNTGLGGRDVFSLATTSGGTILAGTGHGIFRLAPEGWTDSSNLTAAAAPDATSEANRASPTETKRPPNRPAVPSAKSNHTAAARKRSASFRSSRYGGAFLLRTVFEPARKKRPAQVQSKKLTSKPKTAPTRATKKATATSAAARMDSIVYSLVSSGDEVYAGTGEGLLRSTDDGHTWARVTAPIADVHFFAVHQGLLLASDYKQVELSTDDGTTWESISAPAEVSRIGAIAVDDAKGLWIGGREGVFRSTDQGKSWVQPKGLFFQGVDGIFASAAQHSVLVTASSSTYVFSFHTPDSKITTWDSGWLLRFARPVGDHLIAATLFDGMVLQPQMIETPFGK